MSRATRDEGRGTRPLGRAGASAPAVIRRAMAATILVGGVAGVAACGGGTDARAANTGADSATMMIGREA
ncbi:MAG TPA: hypothetical protein VJ803_11750, partial [Gemmatimonadaceae bacterium]|nr:hypothetical protein [Gemmatimonadaceae bacterium]